MMIPMGVFQIEILLALLGTIYLFFGNDHENFTDIISGFVAVIMWFLISVSFLVGIHADGIDYQSSALFWVFTAIGVIIALITFMKLMDSVRTGRDSQNHIGGFDIGKI